MKKILCYIYENMADFEVTLLLHRLRTVGGREIISVSENFNLLTAQSGLNFKADVTIEQAEKLDDIEAIIIPGGPIDNNQNAICPLLKRLYSEEKLIAAICFAPQFLARAGLLYNHNFTTSCSEQAIQKTGDIDPFPRENFISGRVVVSDNIITAQGYAFIDFAKTVCDYLQIFSSPEQLEDSMGKFAGDK